MESILSPAATRKRAFSRRPVLYSTAGWASLDESAEKTTTLQSSLASAQIAGTKLRNDLLERKERVAQLEEHIQTLNQEIRSTRDERNALSQEIAHQVEKFSTLSGESTRQNEAVECNSRC